MGLIGLVLSTSTAGEMSSLASTRAALTSMGGHLDGYVVAADATAEALSAGGEFWVGGHPALISEFSGRAGGFMVLKPLRLDALKAGDVVLYVPGDLDTPEERTALAASGATVISAGTKAEAGGLELYVPTAEAPSPTLASTAAGWVYFAEVIAALTRHGKMPVIYESIGGYGGYQRIAQFASKGIFWHETHTVPEIPPGTLGPVYIAAVSASLARVEAEMGPRLARLGAQVATANAAGKRTIMYNMGHLFPNEVAGTEIATLFESAVWNGGFMAQPAPDDTYTEGDVVIHIGYQHPPYRLLPKVRSAGAQVAYVSVLQHRDYPEGAEGCTWIDPMWPWADGVVTIPNYDVPACPPSGLINGAIAWEIYRQAKQAMGKE